MEGIQAQLLASTPPHPSAALDSLLGIDTQVCESRLTWTVVGEWGIWRNAAGVFRSRFNRLESTIDDGGNQIAGVQHDLPYGRADCPATPGKPCAPNQIRTGVPSLKSSCPRPLDDGGGRSGTSGASVRRLRAS